MKKAVITLQKDGVKKMVSMTGPDLWRALSHEKLGDGSEVLLVQHEGEPWLAMKIEYPVIDD